MPNEPSQLPNDLWECARSIKAHAARMHGCLQALRPLASRDEVAREQIINATVESACLAAEIERLMAWLSAARMCGMMAPPVVATDLELHPVNRVDMLPGLPMPVHDERMLRSLHRAADHSLDINEEGDR